METSQNTGHSHLVHRLLAILVFTVLVAGLKMSAPVTLPLAAALFLVALFWPLQRRLQRHLPRGISLLISLTLFLLAIALFTGALWFSGVQVASEWPHYQERFETYYGKVRELSGGDISKPGALPVREVTGYLFSTIGGFILLIAFFALALLEVGDFRKKINQLTGEAWFSTLHEAAEDFQRYILVRTAVGLITGTLCGLFALAVGLDFAFIWGLLNFLLNYIPTLGSIAAVFPPVLFALLQFESIPKALIVLAGIGGIQLVMGNYVDPLMQGKYLQLSPLVVLLSVVFWGWVWGFAGAFIGIPLTIAVVLVCRRFDRTRWVAVLLARNDEKN